jgi:ribosomal protein S18 acetylase RimI-like enzyme
VRIEDFQPRYAQPLVELWRNSFEHGVGITDPHPLEDQLAYFKTSVLPENRVRVALADSKLVGFIAYSPQSVECLYVAVSYIGQGIGSQLLDLAKSDSSGSLWLYTFAQNVNARAFYERHGFVDTGHGFENMWKLEDIKYVWFRVQGEA